jgi:hypothetical protein
MGEAASSRVTQVAAATSSQDPEVGLAAVAALRGVGRGAGGPPGGERPGQGLVMAADRGPAGGHQAGRASQVRRPSVRLPEVAEWSSGASRPVGCWTWPGWRRTDSVTATSAPSTWCWGCSGWATAGPAGPWRLMAWRRSAAAPSGPLAAEPWDGRSGRRPGRDGVGLAGCRGRCYGTRRCSSAMYASVGLPDGYRGAFEVDLGELEAALLAEFRAGVP